MANTSQIFMVLLNIYVNLSMINPFLHKNELVKLGALTSEIFQINLSLSDSPEAKIDKLMYEYVGKLLDVKNIQDDKKAIETMELVRKEFVQRAQEIQPELKKYLSSLSEKQASIYKEKLLFKPYFKTINDLVFAYTVSSKLDTNPELKKSFQAMDDFLTILYN